MGAGQYATAQFNLGLMYWDGRGIPQDYPEALRWYRLAAEQGYAPAQHNLGSMYVNGAGLPQDYVEAHMWFNLAAARPSGQLLEHPVKTGNVVAERSTADQIVEVHGRAPERMATVEA